MWKFVWTFLKFMIMIMTSVNLTLILTSYFNFIVLPKEIKGFVPKIPLWVQHRWERYLQGVYMVSKIFVYAIVKCYFGTFAIVSHLFFTSIHFFTNTSWNSNSKNNNSSQYPYLILSCLILSYVLSYLIFCLILSYLILCLILSYLMSYLILSYVLSYLILCLISSYLILSYLI